MKPNFFIRHETYKYNSPNSTKLIIKTYKHNPPIQPNLTHV